MYNKIISKDGKTLKQILTGIGRNDEPLNLKKFMRNNRFRRPNK